MFQIIRNFLWRQKAAPHQATFEGYLPYFVNDAFPIEWHKAISESPSAQSCVSTVSDFLEGFGFSDTDLENLKVNRQGQSFFQIHQDTCKSLAEFEGFYWHFMFDLAGRIAEIRVLPFECCRLGKPDSNGIISKIYYNPFFGTGEYKSNAKNDTVIYHTFNPGSVREQISQQQDKFKGQVLFVGTTTATSRFYPFPEAYSAIKWMKSEAGISDYHEDNINNGLLQPYILVMKGDPNAPVNNPEEGSTEEPMTAEEQFQEVVSKNFQGSDRVGNLMVKWVNIRDGEETPEVIPLPSNANGDFFLAVDNQATKKITVAFKVQAILANINEGVSLGGDGNAVRVAVKLQQQRVIKKQRILTDTYSTVLKLFTTPYTQPITIVPYNPYPELEVIDPQIWAALSEEEKRKWIQDHTEIELIEEAEPIVTPDQPLQAQIRNAIPIGFPENVISTVKKALDYDDKMQLKCGKRAGRSVAEKILNNETMGQRQLKRILSYLKKRPEMENRGFEDCEAILYHQWGGKAMEKFLESKLDQIDQWLN